MSDTSSVAPVSPFTGALPNVLKIALIMAFRVIGLFMVLPVMSLYANQFAHGSGFLMGLAMGIYGLSQAALQIPFGILSDRYGRKNLILFGLLLFISGSVLCALSHSILTLIIGRFLQGAGAIGSVLIALIADSTPEYHLGKAMAVVGMTMGSSFLIAFSLGPYLQTHYGVPALFMIAAVFGVIALLLLPSIESSQQQRKHHINRRELRTLLTDKRLLINNVGIFLQHAMLTANFVVIPFVVATFQISAWNYYLCIMASAFLIALPTIRLAENHGRLRQVLQCAIALTAIAQLVLGLSQHAVVRFTMGLFVYFVGFSTLEALLPAFASKFAPNQDRGFALGIYSSSQFLGLFCGGIIGGLLVGAGAQQGMFLINALLALGWLLLTRQLPETSKN